MDAINEQLKLLSLRIAKSKSKSSSGEVVTYYGVVNMNSEDAFAQVANSLSKVEQEFFHKCAPSSRHSAHASPDHCAIVAAQPHSRVLGPTDLLPGSSPQSWSPTRKN